MEKGNEERSPGPKLGLFLPFLSSSTSSHPAGLRLLWVLSAPRPVPRRTSLLFLSYLSP